MKMKVPQNYCITRIDINKPHSTHGYEVRLRRRYKNFEKFFSDSSFKTKRDALLAARNFRDKVLRENPPFSRVELAELPTKITDSGIVGVTFITKSDSRRKNTHNYDYWKAWWSPKPGIRKSKMFSVNKYGYKTAFKLAKSAREEGLREMKKYDRSISSLSKRK